VKESIVNITEHTAEQFTALGAFLEKLVETGVAIPFPTVTSEEVKFHFFANGLPNEVWLWTEERRNNAVVESFRLVAKTIGGRWAKNDPKKSAYDDIYYTYVNETANIAGLRIVLIMDRNLICERVQVGTEKVVVPAVEAQPEKVIEKPIYETECKPMFAKVEEIMGSQKAVESLNDDIIDAEIVA
jgi:hypothetical protein